MHAAVLAMPTFMLLSTALLHYLLVTLASVVFGVVAQCLTSFPTRTASVLARHERKVGMDSVGCSPSKQASTSGAIVLWTPEHPNVKKSSGAKTAARSASTKATKPSKKSKSSGSAEIIDCVAWQQVSALQARVDTQVQQLTTLDAALMVVTGGMQEQQEREDALNLNLNASLAIGNVWQGLLQQQQQQMQEKDNLIAELLAEAQQLQARLAVVGGDAEEKGGFAAVW